MAERAKTPSTTDKSRHGKHLRHCPYCGQERLVRIHRRWYDWFKLKKVLRYKCRACGREVAV